jgi:hypothetical protein
MTGTEILNTIHTLYENNVDYPTSTDEDYLTRLAYLNQAIQSWQNEVFNGYLWSELFTTTTQAYTTSTIANFLHPEKLYIGSKEYTYVQPYEAVEKIANNLQEEFYYITGGANNKVINIYPQLTSGNYSISYYKLATLYTAGNISQHIEMQNPNYAIRYVLGQLYNADGDLTLGSQSLQEAERYMSQMKTGIDAMPMSSYSVIPDLNDGFGL